MYGDNNPFVAEQAERALKQLLALLHSQWMGRGGDLTGLPYGDRLKLHTRLNKAILQTEDENYLTAVGNAMVPSDTNLAKLRDMLLGIGQTGSTPGLTALLFELLPDPQQRPLRFYTELGHIEPFLALYLIMLRSGFWAVAHDRYGPIDTTALGIDPLHVPEYTEANFRARRIALKGIDEMTDKASLMHWNVLQVLPRLLSPEVDNFLRVYDEWYTQQVEDMGVDEDDYEQ